jgi:hypothetical protein
MNVADVSMLCFNDNAHEMMVHMLMSCSYDAQMQGKHLGCYRGRAKKREKKKRETYEALTIVKEKNGTHEGSKSIEKRDSPYL